MRRKDREITDFTQTCTIIEKCSVLHLGLLDQGKPYIVPVNFGAHFQQPNISLYFHGAKTGKKYTLLTELAQDATIVFEAEHDCRVLKHETPCKWSTSYESVMGEGRVRLLEDDEEKSQALLAVLKHYGYQGDDSGYKRALSSVALFAIDVTEISCKSKIQ